MAPRRGPSRPPPVWRHLESTGYRVLAFAEDPPLKISTGSSGNWLGFRSSCLHVGRGRAGSGRDCRSAELNQRHFIGKDTLLSMTLTYLVVQIDRAGAALLA